MIDAALYLASAVLTAIGLTHIKIEAAAGIADRLDLDLVLRLGGWAVVYFAGMGLWLAAIARNPLSTAYPIGIGLSLASATIAAAWWLGEPVGWLRITGIVLVLAGAVVIARASRPSPH
jgi:multidrug transporter EmrE-like cation transporter